MDQRAPIIAKAKAAILARDWAGYAALLAPDVHWFTPLQFDPIIGRETMVPMQSVVFDDVFDSFEYLDTGYGDRFVYLNFRGTVGDTVVDGTDRVMVGDDGSIAEFHVDGRTLEAMQIFLAAVQNALVKRGLVPAA